MNRVGVRSKLNEFGKVKGLAFGYYSEMSQDVSELIELLVKAKRGSVMKSLGLHSPEEATSWTRKGIMHNAIFRLVNLLRMVDFENQGFS